MVMSQEAAEVVGLNALKWLVGNDELLQVFLQRQEPVQMICGLSH